MINFNDKVNFIWSIAELLRGPYKKEQYGNVILPLCVLRRFDCLLEPTKEQVLEKAKTVKIDSILNRIAGENFNFNNTSKFQIKSIVDQQGDMSANLRDYINGFSKNIREIIEKFEFDKEITKLEDNDLLYMVLKRFTEIELHPDAVSNIEMGYIFEELIRRFSENAEAGDHYTPREVIKLMVYLLLNGDQKDLMEDGKVVTIGDFACGTGGMLSEATEFIKKLNPGTDIEVYGQELNGQSYAICCSDMLIKGQNEKNMIHGNSFTQDGHKGVKVRYALMNPPFGVDWKKDKEFIDKEYDDFGFDGRFGAGLPRTSDGSLLFLQHMISKMKTDEKGSRMAIIFNGSPLFTGDAGSGESDIRKWIIENDLLEGIVALPDQLFYNTGISTYIWILSNRKNQDLANGPIRKDKIQLIDATSFYTKMRKSLGNKRNEITMDQIQEIARIYGEFKENEYCKKFEGKDFGYHKITVERPLKLNFAISEERIENLYAESTFGKLYDEEDYKELLKKKHAAEKADKKFSKTDENKIDKYEEGKKLQEKIMEILKANISDALYKNREEFIKTLKPLFNEVEEVKGSLFKAIYMGLSERDETADVCLDNKGNIEPDPTLRDTENVPLKEDIYEYFKREVKPHVADAWIDESKTKVGYEIPFTRYFYKYTPLRSSEDIMKEIRELEQSIMEKIKKVME